MVSRFSDGTKERLADIFSPDPDKVAYYSADWAARGLTIRRPGGPIHSCSSQQGALSKQGRSPGDNSTKAALFPSSMASEPYGTLLVRCWLTRSCSAQAETGHSILRLANPTTSLSLTCHADPHVAWDRGPRSPSQAPQALRRYSLSPFALGAQRRPCRQAGIN